MLLKKSFLNPLFALLLLFILAACNSDDKKIAIVDAELVYQKSSLASAGMKHLESLTGLMQTSLAQMQEQLKAKPDDKDLEQRLQNQLFTMQANLDKAQRSVAERVNKYFDDAVEECRKQQNFEVVLPKQLVMAIHPDADITTKIIAIMDTKTVDFADIGLEQTQDAEAQDAQKDAGQDAQKNTGQDAAADHSEHKHE